jgi:amino-acid N-acetyltransferase
MQNSILLLREALPYFRMFSGKIVVLKFSGKNLEKEIFENLASDLVLMELVGVKIIIVHGAGPQIDDNLPKASKKINGIRITTQKEMDIIVQVIPELSNYIKKGIEELGISACFLPSIFTVTRKNFLEYPDQHWTGEIQSVDTERLKEVLQNGIIPIFSPVVQDQNGQYFNVNADELAVSLAASLNAKKLVFFTDVDGVYDLEGNVMPFIPLSKISSLEEEGIISDGMIPKVQACKRALEGGVGRCHIVSGIKDGVLLKEFFTREGSGTMLLENPNAYEHIRKAMPRDIPFLFRILEEGHRDGFLRKRTKEELIETLQDFSVFEIDDQVIGCASLTEYESIAEIGALISLTKFQGKGIASLLVQDILAKAKEKNLKGVFVVTNRVGSFFERCGFVQKDPSFLPMERNIPLSDKAKVYFFDF